MSIILNDLDANILVVGSNYPHHSLILLTRCWVWRCVVIGVITIVINVSVYVVYVVYVVVINNVIVDD